MSIPVTKFEVYATWVQSFDPSFATFKANLSSLSSPLSYYQVSTIANDGTNGQGLAIYGMLTNAEASTALGYLNTLNTALTANSLGTVNCISYGVTLQP